MPGWAGVPPMVSPDPVKVGQGQARGQGPGDDAERPAGLVAGEQVPLVGPAEDRVRQTQVPLSRKPPLPPGSHT